MKPLILKEDILAAFRELGIRQGMTVMTHTSLSSLGYVCGGAQTVIEALLETVTREGTIVMPTQSWKNLDPDVGVHSEISEADWQRLRDHWPAYDKRLTPTQTMGTVAEMFRQWPGTLRSDHPARSVAANGRHARRLTKSHDLQNIFGDGSPIGRLYNLDAYVLLIGVGYESGKRVWKAYETLYVDGHDFVQIGEAFEQTHTVRKVTLGNATLRLMRQRELVDFAVNWIERFRL